MKKAEQGLYNKDFKSLHKLRKKRLEEKKGIIKNFQLLNEMELNFKVQNKYLSIVCVCFIQEFDILMVSSTNNTITAWHFSKTEIKNVNVTSDYKFTKDELKLAILIANYPQYTMIWDPQMKCLFTGQKDGKILKWELINPNPILDDTLDANIVKKKLEKNNKKNDIYQEETKNIFVKFKDKPSQFNDKINSYLIEDKKKNLSVSCLIIYKKIAVISCILL